MAIITAVVVLIVELIRSAFSRQLSDEFKAWVPWLVGRLIKRSVNRLPESQRRRFEEEWRSHVNEIPGDAGKLVVAIGLLTAARRMTSIVATGSAHASKETRISQTLRRSLDLFLASNFLIYAAPAFLVTALMIRLSSVGPVFVRSKRAGRHGRVFELYQFRVAETPIGSFLQSTSVYMLPCLINLLRGEMSLIGPAPEFCPAPMPGAGLDARSVYTTDRLRVRLSVKPGMTGLAQVCCPDGSCEEKLAYDEYYVKNRCLSLDLLILSRTFANRFKKN